MTDRVAEAMRQGQDGRRATVRDVAAAAGVSRSTASRALTGIGYVGHGVRERVQHAAEALGYVPDAMARHLKQQVSRSIGLLVPDLRSSFGADVVAGVTREAQRRGYATILTGDPADDPADDPDGLRAAERLVAHRVAGVVVVPVSGAATAYLTRRRTAVVEVGRHVGPSAADVVVVDDERLTHELTSHLLGLGHRRPALLLEGVEGRGPTSGSGRRDGFLAACRDAGLGDDESLVVDVDVGDPAQADARLAALLAAAAAPTAVVAASAPLAAAAWRTAAHRGLRVPRDLSLVAVDDAPWMDLVTPGVTAGERDGVGLGAAAVGRLLERAHTGADGTSGADETDAGDHGTDGTRRDGGGGRGVRRATTVLEPRVVHRESTAPPALHPSTVQS